MLALISKQKSWTNEEQEELNGVRGPCSQILIVCVHHSRHAEQYASNACTLVVSVGLGAVVSFLQQNQLELAAILRKWNLQADTPIQNISKVLDRGHVW